MKKIIWILSILFLFDVYVDGRIYRFNDKDRIKIYRIQKEIKEINSELKSYRRMYDHKRINKMNRRSALSDRERFKDLKRNRRELIRELKYFKRYRHEE